MIKKVVSLLLSIILVCSSISISVVSAAPVDPNVIVDWDFTDTNLPSGFSIANNTVLIADGMAKIEFSKVAGSVTKAGLTYTTTPFTDKNTNKLVIQYDIKVPRNIGDGFGTDNTKSAIQRLGYLMDGSTGVEFAGLNAEQNSMHLMGKTATTDATPLGYTPSLYNLATDQNPNNFMKIRMECDFGKKTYNVFINDVKCQADALVDFPATYSGNINTFEISSPYASKDAYIDNLKIYKIPFETPEVPTISDGRYNVVNANFNDGTLPAGFSILNPTLATATNGEIKLELSKNPGNWTGLRYSMPIIDKNLIKKLILTFDFKTPREFGENVVAVPGGGGMGIARFGSLVDTNGLTAGVRTDLNASWLMATDPDQNAAKGVYAIESQPKPKEYSTIKLEFDFSKSTYIVYFDDVLLKANGTTQSEFKLNSSSKFDTIDFATSYKSKDTYIDNVKIDIVPTACAKSLTIVDSSNATTNKFNTDDVLTAKAVISNSSTVPFKTFIVIAGYDINKKIVAFSATPATTETTNDIDATTTASLKAVSGIVNVKAFLWNSETEMVPIKNVANATHN